MIVNPCSVEVGLGVRVDALEVAGAATEADRQWRDLLMAELAALREEMASLRKAAEAGLIGVRRTALDFGEEPKAAHMLVYTVGSTEPYVLRMRGTTDPSHTAIDGERSASGDAPQPS